ncbi:MAG: 2OG-Fe(II) oxygenase [Scytonema sp. PMC 1070.18]|nr:2OG-Fe(II) oxygenase [Scytonema sp. PMC 1070.18]
MKTIVTQVRNTILKNLYEVSFVKNPAEMEYSQEVKKYAKYLPKLPESDRALLDTINTEGVAITSLEALSIPSTPQMLKAAQQLIPTIPNTISGHENEYVVHATSQQILEYPEIFLWGLEQRLLNIAENYLGLAVAYHGVFFRRDLTNHVEKKSRLWHIDSDDRKFLKIIVYLNDIDENGGPFQYLPPSLSSQVAHALGYKYGYVKDRTMQRVISPSLYRSCTGCAGTVVFADTANIFHRGKVPINSDRFAVFYDYTSRQPKFPFYCQSSMPEEDLVQISSHLSGRQKEYVFWRQHYQSHFGMKHL